MIRLLQSGELASVCRSNRRFLAVCSVVSSRSSWTFVSGCSQVYASSATYIASQPRMLSRSCNARERNMR